VTGRWQRAWLYAFVVLTNCPHAEGEDDHDALTEPMSEQHSSWKARFESVGLSEADSDQYARLFVEHDMPRDVSLLSQADVAACGVSKVGHQILIMQLRKREASTRQNDGGKGTTPGGAPASNETDPLIPRPVRMVVQQRVQTPCAVHLDREAVQICADCNRHFCLACCQRVQGSHHNTVIVCKQCAQDNCCHDSTCAIL
jgi:hypothetical protein